MNPEDFPIGLAAIALIVAYAGYAVIRGVFRMAVGGAALLAGGLIGYWAFGALPGLLGDKVDFTPGMLLGSAAGVGIAAYVVIRGAIKKVVGGAAQGAKRGGIAAAALGLIPIGGLVWLGGSALRDTGLLAELDQIGQAVDQGGGEAKADDSPFAGWRRSIDDSWVGSLVGAFSPQEDDAAASLSKLLLVFKDPAAWDALKANPQIALILEHPRCSA
ncbi:MAG: hypothetical protein R3F11_29810 [Verrucomicrobiales bacterium]